MTPTTTYTQALVRIKELENDAARWRHAHDEIVKYAADKSEEARESLQEAGEEITRLREENAELQNERDKYIGATQCATRSAERRWQKLQAIMQIIGTQGDPEVEVSAVMTDLERANNENAALREDKARLDWLERELIDEVFPIIWIEYNEYGVERISFTYRDADSSCSVTDPTIRGAIDKAFARLDATRKGGKG